MSCALAGSQPERCSAGYSHSLFLRKALSRSLGGSGSSSLSFFFFFLPPACPSIKCKADATIPRIALIIMRTNATMPTASIVVYAEQRTATCSRQIFHILQPVAAAPAPSSLPATEISALAGSGLRNRSLIMHMSLLIFVQDSDCWMWLVIEIRETYRSEVNLVPMPWFALAFRHGIAGMMAVSTVRAPRIMQACSPQSAGVMGSDCFLSFFLAIAEGDPERRERGA
mmetsp:Transcript_45574/g.130010  ORF Transcript_45574/g.130010 Transcript_45574/m.130010 type:complete len:227 (+) Transcript_45574:1587-2267(+)